MNQEKLAKYAPLVLRISIAVVLLWFGFSQIKNPAGWTRMVPDYAGIIPFETTTLIYMNGALEITLATLLLLGLFTRAVSAVSTIHLFHITSIVGYGATGARDIALAIAALAIFLGGADEFSLDKLLFRKKEHQHTQQPSATQH